MTFKKILNDPVLLSRVASYLSQKDLAELSCVNSTWWTVFSTELWRKPVIRSHKQLKKLIQCICLSIVPGTKVVSVPDINIIETEVDNRLEIGLQILHNAPAIPLGENPDIKGTVELNKIMRIWSARGNPRSHLVKELDLSQIEHRWEKVTSRSIFSIVALCPNMKALSINFLKAIVPLDTCTLMYMLPENIEALDLSNTWVDDFIIDCLVSRHGKSIKKLDLSDTNVTDETLQQLAKSCPGLEELSINRIYEVSDPGIKAVVDGCADLVFIEADGCPSINCQDLIDKVNEKSEWEDI